MSVSHTLHKYIKNSVNYVKLLQYVYRSVIYGGPRGTASPILAPSSWSGARVTSREISLRGKPQGMVKYGQHTVDGCEILQLIGGLSHYF